MIHGGGPATPATGCASPAPSTGRKYEIMMNRISPLFIIINQVPLSFNEIESFPILITRDKWLFRFWGLVPRAEPRVHLHHVTEPRFPGHVCPDTVSHRDTFPRPTEYPKQNQRPITEIIPSLNFRKWRHHKGFPTSDSSYKTWWNGIKKKRDGITAWVAAENQVIQVMPNNIINFPTGFGRKKRFTLG